MDLSVAYDEQQIVTLRKVHEIIKGIDLTQSVAIYGSAEHTDKLIRYTPILQKNLKYFIIKDEWTGDHNSRINLQPAVKVLEDPPDMIVVSAFEEQEQIAQSIRKDLSYAGPVIFLYDKQTDCKPFYSDVFRILTPPPLDERLLKYVSDLNEYFRLAGDPDIPFVFTPILGEDVPETPIPDHHYFYQDTWCARKVFENQPEYHVDVGSSALLVGILSQFTRVCSIDIRPLPVELKGLECRKGSILELPFGDREIKSISSLCVVEHVGLGRYGDEIDPLGSEKAIYELKRVLAPEGNLYLSVPIGIERIVFNAERIFDLKKFLALFSDFRLVEAAFIYGNKLISLEEWEQMSSKQETVGLFHFRRNRP
ncbi:DUF268 domain-containing protein [Effusibacillus consociatus]|uniref:DUF268 domain-containing protein n=1 Tax=Effusibacillus consociatus TaxID=1117041 RepID=A0ABV9Q3P5_9BACL